MKIEQLEAVLEMAVKAGAIKSWRREKSDDGAHFCRNFYIVGNLNDHYTIEWYTNMMTLKSRTMELWCDDICLSHSHPCYDVALGFFYKSSQPIAHIGEKHEHLKDKQKTADGWIDWDGSDSNPVPGKKVMYKLRDGYESRRPVLSDSMTWEIVGRPFGDDIIAYRVVEE
ncbi:hypothetical protein CPM16_003172 [Escherichia coli]|nr:hypothetical protein [Escherichia coli]